MFSLSGIVKFSRFGGADLLVDASLKATVLLLAAAIAAHILRSASAAVRHRIWSLGLMCALLIPLASLSVPQIGVPVLPPRSEWPETEATSGGIPLSTGTLTANPTAVGKWGADLEHTGFVAGSSLANAGSRTRDDARLRTESGNQIARDHETLVTSNRAKAAGVFSTTTLAGDFRLYACGIWLAGLLFVLGVLGATLAFRNRVLLRKVRRLDEDRWIDLIVDLSARIGLRRSVVAFESSLPVVPMTWGCLRPVVLLPMNWGDWSEERLRCVLLHELAHVKRFDVVFQMIGRLAAGFYWFHPLGLVCPAADAD